MCRISGQQCSLTLFDHTGPQRQTVQALIRVHADCRLRKHKWQNDIPFSIKEKSRRDTHHGFLLLTSKMTISCLFFFFEGRKNVSNNTKYVQQNPTQTQMSKEECELSERKFYWKLQNRLCMLAAQTPLSSPLRTELTSTKQTFRDRILTGHYQPLHATV